MMRRIARVVGLITLGAVFGSVVVAGATGSTAAPDPVTLCIRPAGLLTPSQVRESRSDTCTAGETKVQAASPADLAALAAVVDQNDAAQRQATDALSRRVQVLERVAHLGLSLTAGTNGSSASVTGTGLLPGSRVQVRYLSALGTPTRVSVRGVAAADGTFTTVEGPSIPGCATQVEAVGTTTTGAVVVSDLVEQTGLCPVAALQIRMSLRVSGGADISATGTDLLPGSTVVLRFTPIRQHTEADTAATFAGTAGPDGSFTSATPIHLDPCDSQIQANGTDLSGHPVSSNLISSVPGTCPVVD